MSFAFTLFISIMILCVVALLIQNYYWRECALKTLKSLETQDENAREAILLMVKDYIKLRDDLDELSDKVMELKKTLGGYIQ